MEHSLAPSGRGFTAPEGGTDRWHTFAALWRDLPAFSRYAGHLLLLVVFALLGQRLLPQNLRIPRLGAWLAPQMVLWAPHEEDLTLPYYGEAEPEPRYLERGAVPLTLRLTGETRRIGEPERQVRTSVIEYTVQKGDSVLSIAQMFGLKSTSILWANGTLADNPDFLRVGQKLNILPVDGVYHTVAKGETLDAIAAKYKVRPEDILGYGGNHLTSASDLQVGQKLI
ncbi:MAG: LysM peptidoglycan-binding domain-containing protein, partial [Chloroflexi bacterium]|nr:LysM peptidoglycan-binding domain-containing protein [Chloroflexota bacterium]